MFKLLIILSLFMVLVSCATVPDSNPFEGFEGNGNCAVEEVNTGQFYRDTRPGLIAIEK